ncbi:N-acetyltransferase [Paenibacillus nanensis]|uniref:N-acetyltransferase n=1 Tax=Paenibacillus nanensis TaxID=393251 RepID=A0A3A1UNL8_9BACL|nr:GNAT family protein [Paenibacillus nanensis]RIX50148.1 N-acetyltransferase [Paenibacillus nanensis]
MNDDSIYLRRLDLTDAPALLALRLRNRAFLQPFEPVREEAYFTLETQEKEIAAGIQGAESDQSYIFGIFLQEKDTLIGRIALTGLARGPFQNANMGYCLDQAQNGKGYMTRAVVQCVQYAFDELGLHRIQAAVMPRNKPSLRVLAKAGFRREGLAEKYLNINGVWEDHVLFARTAEDIME